MQSAEMIWNKTLDSLREVVNPNSISKWIEPLKPISVADGKITIATSEQAVFDTINLLYKDSIQNVINTVSEDPLVLDFRLGDMQAPQPAPTAPMLISKYTFDTFVVGESNAMAHAAAMAITDFFPDTRYNPFFLYGGVGLGKTHLLHAIGNSIYQKFPDKKILYVTSDTFVNEVIAAIRPSPNDEGALRSAAMRKKFRDVDILMVDDIQFIAGKSSTESEFFHTFNSLFLENKQIIITSDRPPQAIPLIDDRMTSRFASGIVVDIQSPDFETRVAILRNKAQLANVSISNDLLEVIATKVDSNVRALDSALTNVLAYAQLGGSKLSRSLIDRVLKDMVQNHESRRITADMVIGAVSDYYDVTVEELTGKKRDKYVALARQLAMYLCREIIDMPYKDIGDSFGGKHYSTVIHGYESIAERLKSSPGSELQVAVDDITSRLKSQV